MPEWWRASEHALFNLDHIVAIRRLSNGMTAIITTHSPQGSYTSTEIPYDTMVERLEEWGKPPRD